MRAIDQVISYELASHLKDLGVPQNGSLYYWGNEEGETEMQLYSDYGEIEPASLEMQGVENVAAAFTSAELGAILPFDINYKDYGIINLELFKVSNKEWRTYYRNRDETVLAQVSESEAESRGLMIEFLSKNNLINL
jgi:hypothetical protein